MTRMGPSGLGGEASGLCSKFPGTPVPLPQTQAGHTGMGRPPRQSAEGCSGRRGLAVRGRGSPGHLGGSSSGLTGLPPPEPSETRPPPLSQDLEPPHPSLAPESTQLAHPAEGPRLRAAPPPPRGRRRLSLLRPRRRPPSRDPAALVALGPPLGMEAVPAREPARMCALTRVHVCGHPAATAAGSCGAGGPGAGASRRFPLPPPSPASDPWPTRPHGC